MNKTTRPNRFSVRCVFCLLAAGLPALLPAQQDPALGLVLDRLERLEKQNSELLVEIRALRSEVATLRGEPAPQQAAAPATEERLAVAENRIEEQAQTKVEASQRFPIRFTGMALVNAFTNSTHGGGRDNPTLASRDPEPRSAGATVRQSVIGLEFRGPTMAGGGAVSGSLFMDFYSGPNDPLSHYFRIRTASIRSDWKNTTLLIGQEKPIVSPREPNSLAQVGVSPLTYAGNLWLWQPQVRAERRFHFSDLTMFRVQGGVYQSREGDGYLPAEVDNDDSYEERRPAYQGRFELSHTSPSGFRIEIAPGLHASTSHVLGASVPSRLASLDWFVKPAPKVEISGMLFTGKNLAGLGGLRQGFTVDYSGRPEAVGSIGGWAQFTLLPTQRITLNLFGGQQDDRNSDLPYGGIGKNQAYGGNIMFRIAPNTILSLENLRTWTTYLGQGTRLNSHYDLAVAYLF